jgi:type VI secretion system protein ImpA
MSSPTAFDIEPLLQPISAEKPCGEPLRFDPLMDEIRASRPQRDTDPLVQNEEQEGNWPRIIELATEGLATRSKDLYLAAYLTEALINLRDASNYPCGFAGLSTGLRIIRGLVDRFWDGLYPEVDPEDGDLAARVAPLVWMTDPMTGAKLPNQVRAIPVTPFQKGDEISFSWSFWNSRIPQPKAESETDAMFERRKLEAEKRGQMFEETVARLNAEYCKGIFYEIEDTRQAMAETAAAVDARFGEVAPGWTTLRNAVDDCYSLVKRIATDKGVFATGETGGPGEEGQTSAEGPIRKGPIKSRAEAIARLEEAAKFLREIEPHSPVAYLVERAVAWSRMPFDQVIKELVKDNSVMDHVRETLGIQNPAG